MKRERLITKFQYCDRHRAMFLSESVYRRAEVFAEGGWAHGGPCYGGRCRIWPGRDYFVAELCRNGAELAIAWPDGEE